MSLGQALLTVLEDDAILTAGPALVGFFQQVQVAGTDPLKLSAAWVQLQGTLPTIGIGLAGELEGQLAQLIVNKLQALLATVPKPPAPPVAVAPPGLLPG